LQVFWSAWNQMSAAPSACKQTSPGLTIANVTHEGHTLFSMAVHAPAMSDGISRHIREYGHWDISDPQQLAAMAGAGAVLPRATRETRPILLDVGANIGYYSFLFAHHGWTVFAIEPLAHNRAAIRQTLLCHARQLAQRIAYFAVALGSTYEASTNGAGCVARVPSWGVSDGVLACGRQRASLWPTGWDGTCRRNTPLPCCWDAPPPAGMPPRCSRVNLTTLDVLLTRLPSRRIDLLKLDVERHECSVLSAGGQRLFRQFRPKFVHWEGKTAASDRCVRALLSQFGYRVGKAQGPDRNTVAFCSSNRPYCGSAQAPVRFDPRVRERGSFAG